MPWIVNRDTVALHAAARALLLLDSFKKAAEAVELKVRIRPEGTEGAYTVTSTISWPNRRAGDWYRREQYQGRDEIIRNVAQYVIHDAAEDVTAGLSDEDRAAALEMAYDMTRHFVSSSLAYVSGASERELRDMAQASFDLAVKLLRDRKEEFGNLTAVFRRRDQLEGRKTIEVAAWTGLAPPLEP